MAYNKAELTKLENMVKEHGFTLRYEKGNFDAGHCIVNDKKIIIINKFFRLRSKIECLTEIVEQLSIIAPIEENPESQLELSALTIS